MIFSHLKQDCRIAGPGLMACTLWTLFTCGVSHAADVSSNRATAAIDVAAAAHEEADANAQPDVEVQAAAGGSGRAAVQITGDHARIDPLTGDLVESGRTHRFIYKPTPLQPWVRQPWISPSQSYAGHRAIGLEILPSGIPTEGASAITNDKANLTLAKFPLDSTAYMGFAMMLSSGRFDVPAARTLLAQMWQGAPYGPPVSLHLFPKDPQFACVVRIANNKTGGNPGARLVELRVGTCAPGTWHTFRIGVTPHYPGQPGTGKLVVWHNDMQRPVATWTGDIGFDPGRPVEVNGTPGQLQSDKKPNPNVVLFFGPYRDAQNTRAQTFWANIKYATTAEGADPTIP